MRRFLGLVGVVALLVSAACAQDTHKNDSNLPLELPLRPLSISNSNGVCGATNDQHAARWNSKVGLRRIPLPQEFALSECTSINSRGDAVGTAATTDSQRRVAFAVLQDNVKLLPGEQSRANAINEHNVIVGQAMLAGSKSTAPVVWKHSVVESLDICCAAMARAVNARGMIVGDAYDKDGHYHAFAWDRAQSSRLLKIPGEQYSSAIALNDRGEILLKTTPGGLFLSSNGRLRPIEASKATPRSMNNHGTIVGSFGPNPDAQRAFVWDKTHGLRDLNSLIPPGSGWTLEVASAINDRGEIVGWGDHNGTENVGFLLRLPLTTSDH